MHGRPLQHSPRPSSSIKRPTSKGEEMERVEGGGERERRGDEMVPPAPLLEQSYAPASFNRGTSKLR